MNLEKSERDALIKYRVERSKSTIVEAENAIRNKDYFSAVNRIYYSIFYMLSALALKNEFSTSKHSQLIGWFNKNFVKTNVIDKKFSEILITSFNNRTKGDYGDFVSFSKEQVDKMFDEMNEMISELEKLIL